MVAKSIVNLETSGNVRELTEDERKLFERCLKLDEHNLITFSLNSLPKTYSESNCAKILDERINGWSKAKITLPVAIFILYLAKGNDAKTKVLAYMLTKMYYEKQSIITMFDLGIKFMFGIPSQDSIISAWYYQKEKGIDILDMQKNWNRDNFLSYNIEDNFSRI